MPIDSKLLLEAAYPKAPVKTKSQEFLDFEYEAQQELATASRQDREFNSDNHGNYEGSYEPERLYVVSILAFIHEYELDFDPDPNIPDDNQKFRQYYKKFNTDVTYYKTRLRLRQKRNQIVETATDVKIAEDYKADIHSNLDLIRKIVNSNVDDQNKKDAIFKKIASLQSEVDRDRTTVDAVFSRILDLSAILGEAGEKLEPAVDKLERVMKVIKDGSELFKIAPPKKHKQIEDQRVEGDEEEVIF